MSLTTYLGNPTALFKKARELDLALFDPSRQNPVTNKTAAITAGTATVVLASAVFSLPVSLCIGIAVGAANYTPIGRQVTYEAASGTVRQLQSVPAIYDGVRWFWSLSMASGLINQMVDSVFCGGYICDEGYQMGYATMVTITALWTVMCRTEFGRAAVQNTTQSAAEVVQRLPVVQKTTNPMPDILACVKKLDLSAGMFSGKASLFSWLQNNIPNVKLCELAKQRAVQIINPKMMQRIGFATFQGMHQFLVVVGGKLQDYADRERQMNRLQMQIDSLTNQLSDRNVGNIAQTDLPSLRLELQSKQSEMANFADVQLTRDLKTAKQKLAQDKMKFIAKTSERALLESRITGVDDPNHTQLVQLKREERVCKLTVEQQEGVVYGLQQQLEERYVQDLFAILQKAPVERSYERLALIASTKTEEAERLHKALQTERKGSTVYKRKEKDLERLESELEDMQPALLKAKKAINTTAVKNIDRKELIQHCKEQISRHLQTLFFAYGGVWSYVSSSFNPGPLLEENAFSKPEKLKDLVGEFLSQFNEIFSKDELQWISSLMEQGELFVYFSLAYALGAVVDLQEHPEQFATDSRIENKVIESGQRFYDDLHNLFAANEALFSPAQRSSDTMLRAVVNTASNTTSGVIDYALSHERKKRLVWSSVIEQVGKQIKPWVIA